MNQQNDAWVLLQSLINHLVESGVVDREEFSQTVLKWRKANGLDIQDDPLDFIDNPEGMKVVESPSAQSSPKNDKEKNLKVLIVDNVPLVRNLVKNTLSQYGFHSFIEGENGLQAVDLVREESPDLVLMDIEMKGMNGLDALKEIRSFDTKTPVIIMTGNPTQEYVTEAIRYGMTDFLTKPLNVERILSVVGKYYEI